MTETSQRLLGVLGGMSWTSTETYYRGLNSGVAARLGGMHSARVLVHSVDFEEIAELQHAGDWSAAAEILGTAGRGLAAAGAQGLVIATNTMHKVADEVEAASGLPLLHIADATAEAVLDAGLHRVGLIATGFTMEDTFYVGRLAEHGIETTVPDAASRAEVHRIIYDELVRDVVEPASRDVYRQVMADLVDEGVEGIVLGCTEVGLLVGADDTSVPTFDTVALHVEAAVDWLLDPTPGPTGWGNGTPAG
jgi:aspartate racemase